MRKFWQKEWFDIKFASFCKPNPRKVADEQFYSSFYREFFNKYKSYEDLPICWRKEKEEIASFIHKLVKNKKKVLAIGCGIGYVENTLHNKKIDGELVAIEPSVNATKWLNDNNKLRIVKGYFPTCLVNYEKFDFAYMSYIDYVFNDESYIEFLKDIRKYPIKETLVIGACVNNPGLVQLAKYLVKKYMIGIGLLNWQLWGWQRTIEEHVDIFKKAGYLNIENGQLENGSYWFLAKK